jgi:hypothetical protein
MGGDTTNFSPFVKGQGQEHFIQRMLLLLHIISQHWDYLVRRARSSCGSYKLALRVAGLMQKAQMTLCEDKMGPHATCVVIPRRG